MIVRTAANDLRYGWMFRGETLEVDT